MSADLDVIEVINRGRPRPTFPPVPFAPFVEPGPLACPTDLADAIRLMRGAWAWSVRKVLNLKVSSDDRGQYALRKDDAARAQAVFIEKRMQPAAWIAWRAKVFVRGASHPPSLGWMLAASLLEQPQTRGWFRSSTEGMFGGRVAPTKSQAEFLARHQKARVVYNVGLAVSAEDAMLEFAVDALSYAMRWEQVMRGEVERARHRCADRARSGDPMAVRAPDEWQFSGRSEG